MSTSGGIENIGVGSPVTIAKINEIINVVNKLRSDLDILQIQTSKSTSSPTPGDETSIDYNIRSQYSQRQFKVTGKTIGIPDNAVFKGVDIIGIRPNDGKGTNILKEGFKANIEIISGIDTKTIEFRVKVSRESNATRKNPDQNEICVFKFNFDYELSSN